MFFGLFKHKREDHDTDQKIHLIEEWPDHVISLTGKSFDEFIEQYPISVIDFWAPWCTPCRAVTPRLRRLSKIYKGRVAIGKLDIQQYTDIGQQYKIMGIPHLIFFRFGKIITSLTGLKSVGEIKKVIDNLLKKEER